MFFWPCISTYLCDKNQLNAPFILSLFRHSTSTCFGHICSSSSGGILCIYKNWYVLCFSVDSLLVFIAQILYIIQGKCLPIATEEALFVFGVVTYVYLILQVMYLCGVTHTVLLLGRSPKKELLLSRNLYYPLIRSKVCKYHIVWFMLFSEFCDETATLLP
jgi:hypothetical protein